MNLTVPTGDADLLSFNLNENRDGFEQEFSDGRKLVVNGTISSHHMGDIIGDSDRVTVRIKLYQGEVVLKRTEGDAVMREYRIRAEQFIHKGR